jgi:hypothetical protein
MSSRRRPLNSGQTMRVGVGVIAVVGLATLLAILFSGGGGGGSGTGGGTGTSTAPATQAVLPATPLRPLVVTIRENTYVVNGRTVDLDTLTDLAGKVPPGDGPAVLVQRSPTSRAKAENDLWDTLNKKGVTFAKD